MRKVQGRVVSHDRLVPYIKVVSVTMPCFCVSSNLELEKQTNDVATRTFGVHYRCPNEAMQEAGNRKQRKGRLLLSITRERRSEKGGEQALIYSRG